MANKQINDLLNSKNISTSQTHTSEVEKKQLAKNDYVDKDTTNSQKNIKKVENNKQLLQTNIKSNKLESKDNKNKVAAETKLNENNFSENNLETKQQDENSSINKVGDVYDKKFSEYRLANDEQEEAILKENLASVEKINATENAPSAENLQKKPKLTHNFFKKKEKAQNKNNSGELSYKPPFYQTFKFWAILISCICIVAVVSYLIFTSIKNAIPKVPTGFNFEVQQGDGFAPASDLVVLNPQISNSIQVKVNFKNNFSGNITLSFPFNSGIAKLSKNVVTNGEIVVITPLSENGEIIGGITRLQARYQTIHAELEILIDKAMTALDLSASYSQDDITALTNNGQTPVVNTFFVARDVYLKATPWFGTTPGQKGDDFKRTINWVSSDESIATISADSNENGEYLVKSYKAGSVTFTPKTKRYYNSSIDDFPENNIGITLTFVDVNVESINLKQGMGDITLWLNDSQEIDVRDFVRILPKNMPQGWETSANYLYNNAEIEYWGTNNNKQISISKVEGKPGVFKLYDNNVLNETLDIKNKTDAVTLTIRFGDVDNDNLRLNGNQKITVSIVRNKNFALRLPNNATTYTANITNISLFENKGGNIELTQEFSEIDLLNLFPLEIYETKVDESKKGYGNSFNLERDVVFELGRGIDSNYGTIRKEADSNGKIQYIFVPNANVISEAINGDGVLIKAYLRDVNYGNKEIEGSAIGTNGVYLWLKVTHPSDSDITVNGRIPTISILKDSQTHDIYNDIVNSINSVGFSFRQGTGSNYNITISHDDLSNLFSANNAVENNKIYIELSRENNTAIYIRNKTEVGINNNTTVGTTHSILVNLHYVYDIDPIANGRPANSNDVVLKSFRIDIVVE